MMNNISFKKWFEGLMVSKGQASASLFKPGPRDGKHKPHDDIKICGAGGGPAPCNTGGGGISMPQTSMPQNTKM
ncbi:MAG: hypothetical protein EKK64_03500 [Neisseriaceae bacterium]|nr:MAG: hypothetical protein EKK64_03500 [Neisseriaceae bacterium]